MALVHDTALLHRLPDQYQVREIERERDGERGEGGREDQSMKKMCQEKATNRIVLKKAEDERREERRKAWKLQLF